MVIPCNEEQRSQAAYQACKRVRSSLTHRVGMSEGSKLTIHRDFQRLISNQLRFLGSLCLFIVSFFSLLISLSRR